MSNWIYNKVKIYGTDKEVADVRAFAETPGDPFDFRKAVPEPDFSGEHPEFANAWRVDNWGTRSPASYDLREGMGWISDNEVWFATVWSEPTEAVRALSERFPDALFWMRSVCDRFGYGYFYTETLFKGGEIFFSDYVPAQGNMDLAAGLMGTTAEEAAGWIDPDGLAEALIWKTDI